ncbi:hypothetical protein [Nocardia heshunensis]
MSDTLPHNAIQALDAGHSAWEEAADDYGRLLAAWLEGGYQYALKD